MTLEGAYFLTQIIAAFAVIGSLLYVGVQLRQNTMALQATARTAAFDGDMRFTQMTVEHPNLISLLTKQDMSDHEKSQLYMFLVGFLRLRERDWLQYRAGVLDQRTWETYEGSITGTFMYVNSRKWWGHMATTGFFDVEFKQRVSDLLRDLPVSKEVGTLSAFE